MATAVRVTRGLSGNSAFAAQVKAAVAAQARRQLEEVAKLAEQAFDEIIQNEFVNDRRPERRRTGRHLLGSSQARVIGETFPFTIEIKSLAEGAKVNSLNFGSQPHEIRGQPFLYYPAAVQNVHSPRRQAVVTGESRNRAGFRTIRATQVDHPGTKAHHFLERALERAVEQVYHKAVTIARR